MAELPMIDFDPAEVAQEFDLHERMKFWESCRPWLLEHGFTMYSTQQVWNHAYQTIPSLPMTPGIGGEFPFAFYNMFKSNRPKKETDYYTDSAGRVVFAQDREGRHVALKLVKNATDEQRIFEMLLQEQNTREDQFIPGVLPTLDLLTFGGHWLAVMPRWGFGVGYSKFSPDTVEQVVHLIREILQGVAFLHNRRIVHRDLDARNLLMNQFSINETLADWSPTVEMREDLRRANQMRYAIFDFNLAILMPPDTSIESCRLPYQETFYGAYCQPPDVSQGEYDYNPFAFDIGSLGILFCSMFQHWTPTLPFLAPLLDGLVTRNVSARFTAVDALAFLDDQYAEIDDEQRSRRAPEMDWEAYRSIRHYETYDRWAGLPYEFVKRWSHLREPKLPWTTKVLRWLCGHVWVENIIRALRRWKSYLLQI